jgi:hypothetical protein
MTQAFDTEALFSKSKVYIERAINAERDGNLTDFQLWASLSLELLGKAALASVHPVLVADPDNPDSLFAACGKPFSPKRRSIAAKTVFERLGHICKHFLKEEQDFCMEMANRRNAELHSGELPYVGMRPIAWVPKMWKVCKVVLEVQGKTLSEWLGAEAAIVAEEAITKAPTVHVVESKMRVHKAKFEKKYPAEADKEQIRSSTTFDLSSFMPLFRNVDAEAFEAEKCPCCGCEGGVAGEKWNGEITDANDPDEPWLELVDSFYVTSAMRCKVCELRLDGRDELEIAGVTEEFIRTEVREPDYEPDYGND